MNIPIKYRNIDIKAKCRNFRKLYENQINKIKKKYNKTKNITFFIEFAV